MVLGANLYFAHRVDKTMAAAFLGGASGRKNEGIDAVELEWAEECPLDPASLLGEPKGKRGANQTSPDVAFVVRLRGGRTWACVNGGEIHRALILSVRGPG